MAKPSGRRGPRGHRQRYELPDRDNPVLIEDVDGVTCVVRTREPLTDADRELLRQFVEQLHLGAGAQLTLPELPEQLHGVPQLQPLDEATVWLDRSTIQQDKPSSTS